MASVSSAHLEDQVSSANVAHQVKRQVTIPSSDDNKTHAKGSTDGQPVQGDLQNPEVAVKETSRCKKIIIGFLIGFLVIGAIIGIIFGIIHAVEKESFQTHFVSSYNIPGTNQTVVVHSWTYKKKSVFGDSTDLSGHKVTVHNNTNRLLHENWQTKTEHAIGYIVQALSEAGVLIKYFNNGISMETDPNKNIGYARKSGRRMLATGNSFLSQADKVAYMNQFHHQYAATMGVQPDSTDIAYVPSYEGSESNGEFTVEHQNNENSRLLESSVHETKNQYYRSVAKNIHGLVQRNIQQIQKIGHWHIHFHFHFFRRRLTSVDVQNKLEQQIEKCWSGLFKDQCKPLQASNISSAAWEFLQKCTFDGKHWICSKEEWTKEKPVLKRSEDCKTKESSYKAVDRYIAYLKTWPGRQCAA